MSQPACSLPRVFVVPVGKYPAQIQDEGAGGEDGLDWNTLPKWTHGLQRVLTIEPAAVYVSEEDAGVQRREARILFLAPEGLFSCLVEGAEGGNAWESIVTVDWLPLSSVKAARIEFGAGQGGDSEMWAQRYKVTILLVQEFPVLGDEVTLPLKSADYENRTFAHERARDFAVALIELQDEWGRRSDGSGKASRT